MTATLIRQPNIARPIDSVDALSDRSAVPALVIDSVTKRFTIGRKRKPVTAISNVSLRLERGGIHGILGANGSGKSTLIRSWIGFERPSEGGLFTGGVDPQRDRAAAVSRVGYVNKVVSC